MNSEDNEERSRQKKRQKTEELQKKVKEAFKIKSPILKGNWLEEETKDIIEELGGICTISKAHSFKQPPKGLSFNFNRDFKILGDYGLDGIGEITFNKVKYHFILQCKMWNKKISSSEINAFSGTLSRFKNYIGLFITGGQGANIRAINSAKEASQTIIIINIEELYNLQEILEKTEIKTLSELTEEIDKEYENFKADLKENIIYADKFRVGIKRTYSHLQQTNKN